MVSAARKAHHQQHLEQMFRRKVDAAKDGRGERRERRRRTRRRFGDTGAAKGAGGWHGRVRHTQHAVPSTRVGARTGVPKGCNKVTWGDRPCPPPPGCPTDDTTACSHLAPRQIHPRTWPFAAAHRPRDFAPRSPLLVAIHVKKGGANLWLLPRTEAQFLAQRSGRAPRVAGLQ